MKTHIEAVVGSHAYGLNREGSDIDKFTIFSYLTEDLVGLSAPPDSIVDKAPLADHTYHEIGKFLRLALKCNPTCLEVLWLDASTYVECDVWGVDLIALRHVFLHETGVRNSYGGYARQQLRKYERHAQAWKDGDVTDDVKKRLTKYARHIFRLLHQGTQLLESGSLTVRVENPEFYFNFDNLTSQQITERFEQELALFDTVPSALPTKPDTRRVEGFLKELRKVRM